MPPVFRFRRVLSLNIPPLQVLLLVAVVVLVSNLNHVCLVRGLERDITRASSFVKFPFSSSSERFCHLRCAACGKLALGVCRK